MRHVLLLMFRWFFCGMAWDSTAKFELGWEVTFWELLASLARYTLQGRGRSEEPHFATASGAATTSEYLKGTPEGLGAPGTLAGRDHFGKCPEMRGGGGSLNQCQAIPSPSQAVTWRWMMVVTWWLVVVHSGGYLHLSQCFSTMFLNIGWSHDHVWGSSSFETGVHNQELVPLIVFFAPELSFVSHYHDIRCEKTVGDA